MYKQVLLIRTDLGMGTGKIAAQAAHASLESFLKSDKKTIALWRSMGQKKVTLEVKNEKELLKFAQLADKAKLKNALIRDGGFTEVAPGTITALGIGPDKEEKIDKVTGKLSIL